MTPATDPDAGKRKSYASDPHLDPQLVWAGKAEHTSFEVPTVSLHVHERIDPRTVADAVRCRNGQPQADQLSFFAAPHENPPLREAIDFYQHPHGWSNRLTSGATLVLEVKGRDGQEHQTRRDFLVEWVRAVNAHGGFGRWRWAVSRDPKDVAGLLAAADRA